MVWSVWSHLPGLPQFWDVDIGLVSFAFWPLFFLHVRVPFITSKPDWRLCFSREGCGEVRSFLASIWHADVVSFCRTVVIRLGQRFVVMFQSPKLGCGADGNLDEKLESEP